MNELHGPKREKATFVLIISVPGRAIRPPRIAIKFDGDVASNLMEGVMARRNILHVRRTPTPVKIVFALQARMAQNKTSEDSDMK